MSGIKIVPLTTAQQLVAKGNLVSMFVINQTPKAARSPIMFSVFSQNIEVTVTVENTWLPINLGEFVNVKDLILSPNFMNAINKGLISIVDAEEAVSILESKRGIREKKNVIASIPVDESLPDMIVNPEVDDRLLSKNVTPAVFSQVGSANEKNEDKIVADLLGLAGMNGDDLTDEDFAFIKKIGKERGLSKLKNFKSMLAEDLAGSETEEVTSEIEADSESEIEEKKKSKKKKSKSKDKKRSKDKDKKKPKSKSKKKKSKKRK